MRFIYFDWLCEINFQLQMWADIVYTPTNDDEAALYRAR